MHKRLAKVKQDLYTQRPKSGNGRTIKSWCSLGVALSVEPQELQLNPYHVIINAVSNGVLQLAGVTEIPLDKHGMLHHPLLRPRAGVMQVYFPDTDNLYLQLVKEGKHERK